MKLFVKSMILCFLIGAYLGTSQAKALEVRYGISSHGGLYDAGTLFSYTYDGKPKHTHPVALYSFCQRVQCADGKNPVGNLIVSPDGLQVIGVTKNGGWQDNGVLYELDYNLNLGIWQETNLHLFGRLYNRDDGAHPVGDITQDSDGNIFGTTIHGGYLNHGTIWERVPGDYFGVTIIYNFRRDQE